MVFPKSGLCTILPRLRRQIIGTETYILAGGGSGGHLYPGIALAEALRAAHPEARVLFIGSERPLETTILQPAGYAHLALPVEPLSRLRATPWKFLRRNWSAYRQAMQRLCTERPRWVIGLGGYISAPTVWAAWRLGIPILLLEQNVIPGAATRWLSRCARRVCLSFEETRYRLPDSVSTIVTGNPVRDTIRPGDGSTGPRGQTVLILGGSQGAESLNDAVMAALPELRVALSGWQIVHQAGAGRSAAIRPQYAALGLSAIVEDFFPQVSEWYARAGLVISRAGATTLAELACLGCPSLLIPYPFAADQHQAANAEVFVRRNASLMLTQGDTPGQTAGRLIEPLRNLLQTRELREQLGRNVLTLARPAAAREIVRLLLEPASRTPASVTGRVREHPPAAPHARIPQTQELVP